MQANRFLQQAPIRIIRSRIARLLAGVVAIAFGAQADAAHAADVCGEIRTIYAASASHFKAWQSGARVDDSFESSFSMEGASGCKLTADATTFSCEWDFTTREEMNRAYEQLLTRLQTCPPLLHAAPVLKVTEPSEFHSGKYWKRDELVGLDYPDADVLIGVGRHEFANAPAILNLSPNRVSFTFMAFKKN